MAFANTQPLAANMKPNGNSRRNIIYLDIVTSETEKTFDDGCLAPNQDDYISPDHRAWMNAQIRETLAQIEAGEMGYRSLEDVMREFGFNAR